MNIVFVHMNYIFLSNNEAQSPPALLFPLFPAAMTLFI